MVAQQAPSLLEDLGDWSSIIATLISLLALYIASRSYTDTTAASRAAHMHGLFRDYLYNRNGGLGEGAEDTESAVSVRLYVLEEMFAWTEDELRLTRFWWGQKKRDRIKLIVAWRETVLVHAGYDFPEVVDNIFDYRQCYGIDFLKFLHLELSPERALTSISGRHYKSGKELDLDESSLNKLLRDFIDADRRLAKIVTEEVERRSTGRESPRELQAGNSKSAAPIPPYLPDRVLKLLPRLAELRKAFTP